MTSETEKKIKEEILPLLIGLKKYEWNTLTHVVDKFFASKQSRLELDDPEALKRIWDTNQ